MKFNKTQLEIMEELASFIKLKNLTINNKEEMNFSFSQYLQSNATNYYLKAYDFDKNLFIKKLKQN